MSCDYASEWLKEYRGAQNPYLVQQLQRFPTVESLGPTVSHSIDQKRLKAFLTTLEAPKKKIAQDIVRHTRYLDYKTFRKNMSYALGLFFQALQKKPFLLLVIESIPNKSGFWATLVVYRMLEELNRLPVAICSLPEAYVQYPTITECLLVDDAMYSGEYMQGLFFKEIVTHEEDLRQECNNLPPKHYSIVTAGCTAASLEALQDFIDHQQLTVYCGETFKRLSDVIPQTEADQIKELFGDQGHNYPVIFQHKLADFASSFPRFYSKILQNCDGASDCFVPHYKKLFA